MEIGGDYIDYEVEQAYCPQALVDWYNLGIEDDDYDDNFKMELNFKAFKHLSALGWRFRFNMDCEGHIFLYDSPDGKTFASLRTACKACLTNVDGLKVLDDDKIQSHRKPPARVLCWLVDKDVVLPRSRIHYHHDCCSTSSSGEVTRRGIKCDCCSKLFSLSAFKYHTHQDHYYGHDGQAFTSHDFILEDGRSLMDCVTLTLKNDLINKLKYEYVIYDNRCSFCHEREKEDQQAKVLLKCDRCPSAFHRCCLGLGETEVPDVDHDYRWVCPLCCCGVCGDGNFQEQGDEATATTIATTGVDEREHGRLVVCHQCELNYHAGCVKNNATVVYSDMKYVPDCYFCSSECENIFLGLRKILPGLPIPLFVEGYNNLTWTLWKRGGYGLTPDFCAGANSDRALEAMHECYDPADMYNNVVRDIILNHVSELRSTNFFGFYTAVLKRDNELVSVAAVRIHGRKVAEVPLIGTRPQHRRLGYCRLLMKELEKQLAVLGVERLTLLAVPSAFSICFNSLGFSKMTADDKSGLVKYSLLHLPDTVMCHKLLKVSSCSHDHPNVEH